MKDVVILTECPLPIPAVRGGAVETLVESLLTENEKRQQFHFTVYTRADPKAQERAKAYRCTDFVFIEPKPGLLNDLLFFISRKAAHFRIFLPSNREFAEVQRQLKTLPQQTAYLFEAGNTTQLPLLKRLVGRERLLVHLHWNGMGDSYRDGCFRCLLPVSDFIGKQWHKAAGRPWDEIKTWYSGILLENFTRQSGAEELDALRRQLHIEAGTKVIVFTGRLEPGKGVKELIEAFLALGAKDTVLLIIGSANFGVKSSTPFEQEIEKLVQDSAGRIILTGYVHNSELYKYYQLATIAVMPSKLEESFGLVTVEVQAAGLPLIATRVGATPEVVNKSAILLENDDCLTEQLQRAMASLLVDPERCARMRAEGQAFAKKFSTEQYYQRFCDILNELEEEDQV